MKKIIFLILFFAYVKVTISQNEKPPTLTIGLDGLSFTKGMLDTELISEIISKKQDEIKREFVKNVFAENLLNSINFTQYNYALNSLNLILYEKDKNIFQREILEYTSNFALVYGFTEFYLQISNKTEDEILKNLIVAFYPKDKDKFPFDDNSFILNQLQSKNDIALNNIILDMVFDICRNNYIIQQKGFFNQELNITDTDYKKMNFYKKKLKTNNVTTLNKFIENIKIENATEYIKILPVTELIKEYYTQLISKEQTNKGKIDLFKQNNIIFKEFVNSAKISYFKDEWNIEIERFKQLRLELCDEDKITINNLEDGAENNKISDILDNLTTKYNKQTFDKKILISKIRELKKTIEQSTENNKETKIALISLINLKEEWNNYIKLKQQKEISNTKDIIDSWRKLELIYKINYLSKNDSLLGNKKESFWLFILRKDIENKLNSFFEYYEILKETNFLKGNTFEGIEKYYADLISDHRKNLELLLHELRKEKEKQLERKQEKIKERTKNKQNIFEVIASEINGINTDSISSASIHNDVINLLNLGKKNHKNIYDYFKKVTIQISTKLEHTTNKKDKLYIQECLSIVQTNKDNFSELNKRITKLNEEIESLGKQIIENKNRIEKKHDELLLYSDNETLLKSRVETIRNQIYKIEDKSLDEEDKKLITNINKSLNLLDNPNKIYNSIRFANYLSDSITSKLIILNTKLNLNLETTIRSFRLISILIKFNNLKEFKPKFAHIRNISNINPQQFIDFINNLNNLDKAETYNYLFNVISDAGNMINDPKAAMYFNSIVNNVKKYTVFDTDSSKINVNLELIIVDLYNKYGYNTNRFKLYFSIGANQSFLFNSISLNNKDYSNLSLISEKIGLKITIYDKIRKQMKKQNNVYSTSKSPIVKDFYYFAYGSGLLYNIANTKTATDFNGIIIANGFGISFFNDLDLNLSVGYAITEPQTSGSLLFNIGFDIKITEYLSQLNLKRKNKQRNK